MFFALQVDFFLIEYKSIKILKKVFQNKGDNDFYLMKILLNKN